MNIVWVTSEAVPYAKTGGLADVSSSLPHALADRGHNVSVIMPYYPQVTGKLNLKFQKHYDNVKVPFGDGFAFTRIHELDVKKGLKFFFIEYNRFFDRPKLYDWCGSEYSDNAERFIFLSRAAMELTVQFSLSPDIIHANDWHAALCCVYLKSHWYRDLLPRTKSVMTIHNIGYQGYFSKNNLYWTGLGWEYFNYMCLEYNDALNFLKGGIMTADMVSTVSPTYANEILSPEYGFGLDGALRHVAMRGKLRGILNGIDVSVWNPATDPTLPARYSGNNPAGKEICKRELQKKYNLPQKNVPLFAVISRLASQKGLDVLAAKFEDLLYHNDFQFVMMTSGEKSLEDHFRYLAGKYPDKLGLFIGYGGEAGAHLIEAGADFFLMPSRYEPCGLNQMYSMTYGTLPIVRHTGGLADTVFNYHDGSDLSRSTGFVLWDLNPDSLNNSIRWAADTWRNHPDHIAAMRRNGMSADFSWDKTASEYEKMYHAAHL